MVCLSDPLSFLLDYKGIYNTSLISEYSTLKKHFFDVHHIFMIPFNFNKKMNINLVVNTSFFFQFKHNKISNLEIFYFNKKYDNSRNNIL